MTSDYTEHGLGHIFTPVDELPRNLDYPMRAALLDVDRATRPVEKIWSFGFPALDQEQTGTCEGHSGKDLLLATPIVQTAPTTTPTAFDIYDLSCKLDGIADNDNDTKRTYGTTTNGMMKALRQLGYISEWRWARDVEDAKDWLAFKGPVNAGINWYHQMFYPDADHFVNISGSVDGGHAFVVLGYGVHPTRGPYFRCLNSWGPEWCDNGYFNIAESDFIRLVFSEHGDLAAPLEVALVPPPPPPPPQPIAPVYETYTAQQAMDAGLFEDAAINDPTWRTYLCRWQPVTDAWPTYPYQEDMPITWARDRGLLKPEVLANPLWRVIVWRYQI